jgi:hypothetical protein
MKKLNILFLAAVLFSSCKKDDAAAPPIPDGVTVSPDGTLKPENADGAFYAIQSRLFDTNNGTTYDIVHSASAWVGTFPNIVDAGVVKVGTAELFNGGGFYAGNAILPYDSLFSGNKAIWDVQGNAGTGIAAFTHTDNTVFPAGPNFTLPASININNNLTINHTATGGTIGVLYTLSGDNGDTTKYVPNNSSSITFTSSEIKSVAVTKSEIGVTVMPVTYSIATYGGKKYYFVKQNLYARGTVTQ